MSRIVVGVVEYGVGNHASVVKTFQSLGYKCRLSACLNILTECDVLILPGVGAFPYAMGMLHQSGLSGFLRDTARHGKPIIGLCLGMQLLADESLEFGFTAGLGLIPGTVRPLSRGGWHIGWNSLEIVQPDPLLIPSNGESVYFNHSYVFEAPEAYRAAMAQVEEHKFPVAVRRGNVCGLQFHPEKSQSAGKKLLKRLVEGLYA